MSANGGPAFPTKTENDSDGNLTDQFGTLLPPGWEQSYPGMTLRDYFAARLAPALMVQMPMQQSGVISRAEIAVEAYRWADAMLKARSK